MLVCTHDCFTLASNMEGITAVLRLCKKLTDILARAQRYQLIVSEMSNLCKLTLVLIAVKFVLMFNRYSC